MPDTMMQNANECLTSPEPRKGLLTARCVPPQRAKPYRIALITFQISPKRTTYFIFISIFEILFISTINNNLSDANCQGFTTLISVAMLIMVYFAHIASNKTEAYMLKNIDTSREYISTVQAEERSELSRIYIAQLLRKGILDGFKLGRDWFVYTDSLEAFLQTKRKPGPKGPRKNTTSTSA
jgi:hypothetical protein